MPRSFRFRIIVAALALLAAVVGILEHEDLIFPSPVEQVAGCDHVDSLNAVSGTENLFRTTKDEGTTAMLPSWAGQAVWHFGSGIKPANRGLGRLLFQAPLLIMKSSPGFRLRL